MTRRKAVGETPQKRAARTRAKNKRKNGRTTHVNGFMSGYLLGAYDMSHGVSRSVKQIERIGAAGYDANL